MHQIQILGKRIIDRDAARHVFLQSQSDVCKIFLTYQMGAEQVIDWQICPVSACRRQLLSLKKLKKQTTIIHIVWLLELSSHKTMTVA